MGEAHHHHIIIKMRKKKYKYKKAPNKSKFVSKLGAKAAFILQEDPINVYLYSIG